MRILPQRLTGLRSAPEPAPREMIASIGAPFVDVLCSMYASEPQLGADGKTHALDANTRITPQQGMLIHQLLRETKPENSLEIGLAFGFSTIYFLAAIQANGKGHHTSVDPFQYETWHGVGAAREQVLGIQSGSFEFCCETSIQALARFAREDRRFGVIFIDGDHKFDGVLIDFALASLVCEPGGHIILDDMWMPSIQRAASFIRRNRTDFTEVRTQLSRVSVFRKTDSDKRSWDHFAQF